MLQPLLSTPSSTAGSGISYELTGVLASGGFGTLFHALAQEPAGSRPVAIKRLHPNLAGESAWLRDFEIEVRVGLLLHHPNIIGTEELLLLAASPRPEPVAVLEFVDGPNLVDVQRHLSGKGERLSPKSAASLMRDLAGALAYAYEAPDHEGEPLRLVHRDLKLANLMLAADGSLRLLDLGIARSSLRTVVTLDGVFKGTAPYASPEQALGHQVLTPVSDLFSLGAILFELLAGLRLFPGTEWLPLLGAVATADVAPRLALLPAKAQPLRPLLTRLLKQNPLERPSGAAEVVLELESIMSDLEGDPDEELPRLAQEVGGKQPNPTHPSLDLHADVPGLLYRRGAGRPDEEKLESVDEMLALGTKPHIALSTQGGRQNTRDTHQSPRVEAGIARSVRNLALPDLKSNVSEDKAQVPPDSGPLRSDSEPWSVSPPPWNTAPGMRAEVALQLGQHRRSVFALAGVGPSGARRWAWPGLLMVVLVLGAGMRWTVGVPQRVEQVVAGPDQTLPSRPEQDAANGPRLTRGPANVLATTPDPSQVPKPISGVGSKGGKEAAITSTRGRSARLELTRADKSKVVSKTAPNTSVQATVPDSQASIESPQGLPPKQEQASSSETEPSASAEQRRELVPITITSIPNARVYLNERQVSAGPVRGLSVLEGDYEVRLIAADGSVAHFAIKVQAGRPAFYQWSFSLHRLIGG